MINGFIQWHEAEDLSVLMNEKDFHPDIILLGNDIENKYHRVILNHITQRCPDARIIFYDYPQSVLYYSANPPLVPFNKRGHHCTRDFG
jgi:hypothetical protein